MSYPIIRPAGLSDLPSLTRFAKHSGYGITSLPNNSVELEKKLRDSERSFREELYYPKHETYIFALEFEKKVVGTSGIVSRIGVSEPFFAYHLLYEHLKCPHLNIDRKAPLLHVIRARKKPTEIGTLFLESTFRKKNWGKLLSFSRFLFIAQFKQRFASTVVAEMRGINHNGFSPFWEAVGRPFFQIDFPHADLIRTETHACLEELFPKHPIYVDLLPQEVQQVIGEIHPDTEPARTLLYKQGFKMSHYVDLFDAGPHLYAPTDQIDAVRHSITTTAHIKHHTASTWAILCNTHLNFRATLAPLSIEADHVLIDPQLADALEITSGAPLRYYLL